VSGIDMPKTKRFESRCDSRVTLSNMKPRITLLTLGVDDLDRAIAFYRDGLGLATRGIVSKEFEYGAVGWSSQKKSGAAVLLRIRRPAGSCI